MPQRCGGQPARGARVHHDLALALLPVGVVGSSDQEAGGATGIGRGCGRARGAPPSLVVHVVCIAVVDLYLAAAGRYDEDVVVAIPVHVACRAHRGAELRLVYLLCPIGRSRESAGRAEVDVDESAGSARCADDNVVVAVVIHVAGRAYRGAQPRVLPVALDGPARREGQSGSRAVVDVSPPRIGIIPGIMARDPHDDVVEAVTVHVAGRGQRYAELVVCLVARDDPVRRDHDRIHQQRVGGAGVVDPDRDATRRDGQVGAQLAASCVDDGQVGVAQDGGAASGLQEIDALRVIAERRD